jgi:MFS family permease
MALLTGETVAAVGVEVAQVAIPIIAVTYLVASEFEIGVLGMAEGIAFLLLSLPVGAWVDRVSRRRVMIGANIVRALAMATIPVLWFSGMLDVPQLMGIALTISAAAVFFDTAYMSIVPALVPREQLGDANSRSWRRARQGVQRRVAAARRHLRLSRLRLCDLAHPHR